MGIIGGILIIVGVILFFLGRTAGERLAAMNAANTFDHRTLKLVHQKVLTALDPASFVQTAEIEGIITCEQPLTGPLSGRQVVAYHAVRQRVYEAYVSRTENGRTTKSTERREETVSDSEQSVPFFIEDATGATQVLPEGAEIDMVETANTFVNVNDPWRGDTRTIGYRDIESSLVVGTKVYVLGTAVDHGEEPVLARHPTKPKALFMISRRSERELAQEASNRSRRMMLAAPISAGIGVLMIIADLIMQ